MATFTYTPDYSSSMDDSPNTIDAKFGDGYEQSTYRGINKYERKMRLVFGKRTQDEINDIVNFFKTNNAAITPFDWTPPDGVPGRFKCKKHSTSYVGGYIGNLNCEFEEVFW